MRPSNNPNLYGRYVHEVNSQQVMTKLVLSLLSCYQLLALVYSGSAYLFHRTDPYVFILSGYSILLSFAIVVPLLLVRGYAATFCFIFFLTQPVFQVFCLIFVLQQEPLWAQYFPAPLIKATLRYTFTLTHYTYLLILIGMLMSPHELKRPKMLESRPTAVAFAWAVAGSLTLYVLGVALTTSRDVYLQGTAGGGRFLFVLGIVTVGLGVVWGFSVRGTMMRALGIFCFVLAMAIALSGYRSVLVVVGIASLAIYLGHYRIGAAKGTFAIVGLICSYYMMSVLNYMRNRHYSLGDIIAGEVVIKDWSEVFAYAGRAEQIELFTVYFAQSLDKYWGMTYVYSLARVLPNFIGEGILQAPRPQDILVLGGPHAFVEAGLNLGAYFYAEVAMNFGLVGAILTVTLVIYLFIRLENARGNSRWMTLFYPIVATMTPTLAIYGSANFFKQTLTMSAMSLILYMLIRLRFVFYSPSAGVSVQTISAIGHNSHPR